MDRTKKIKVLNLYAGVGGNIKLWNNVEVVAVENNPKIAEVYASNFTHDIVVICDAHEYLLKNHKKFDFIWSSPPCPTHSDIRRCGVHSGKYLPVYPDMKLYEEIIFLENFFSGKYVIENVISYYEPLIKPKVVSRHYFWSNFPISQIKLKGKQHFDNIRDLEEIKGINISNTNIENKRKVLRNCVHPKLGEHILNCAFKTVQKTLK